MTEEVFKIHNYGVGHRIDRQLLLSLEDIFKQYNVQAVLRISTECANNTKCIFDGIEECFEYFDKKPYRIIKLEIDAILEEKFDSNRITITFDNSEYASTKIKFYFNNNDDYLLLKNKIELCLKNFELNYRILSVVPIMPTTLTLTFIAICVYTSVKDIVFSQTVQCLITSICFGGSLLFGMMPPIVRIKRNLFPCTEFRVGQNELIEKKNETIRNFIIGSVGFGTIFGVIVNYISDFLF